MINEGPATHEQILKLMDGTSFSPLLEEVREQAEAIVIAEGEEIDSLPFEYLIEQGVPDSQDPESREHLILIAAYAILLIQRRDRTCTST